MFIKKFLIQFLRNLFLALTATIAAFTFVIFTFLNGIQSKVTYQGGSWGQFAVSVLLAWVAVVGLSFPILTIFSLIVSYIQIKYRCGNK